MPKDNEVDDDAVAWLIRYSDALDGSPRQTVYTHNTIADWRTIDPAATSEPLYSAATVTALEAEVETCRKLLAEKVTAETMLRELHITPAGLAAQVEGGMAGILMQSIVDQFREIGGPNFFEMKFVADAQQYVLTVQRSAGMTPADKMKAAEQRADAAERRVAELENLLGAWYAEESRYGARLQAPGHHHQVPGIWDSDNGPIAGKPCAKCALWQQIRSLTGAGAK